MLTAKFILLFVVLKSVSAYSYNEKAEKINIPKSLGSYITHYVKSADSGITHNCKNQLQEYGQALLNREMWALKFFDSSSKFPSGILEGNFVDLGFFDECISAENVNVSTTGYAIYGKYCIGTLPLNKNKIKKFIMPYPSIDRQNKGVAAPVGQFGAQFAMCLPHSCSAKDIEIMFHSIGLPFLFYENACQTKMHRPKFDAAFIATTAILGTLLLLVVISTMLDVFCYYSRKDSPHKLLVSFSILSNGRKLIATSTNPNQISCLNGIRVITTMWVILGHRYVNQSNYPVRNFLEIAEWMTRTSSMFIINGPLSVDTFFLLSGLVVCYVFLIASEKGTRFNIIVYYLHRYIRLTPVLIVVALIQTTIFKHLYTGPLYPQITSRFTAPCENYWWKALLYIQNYGPLYENCIVQSWYLSADMHLFILSPILLIPLKLWPVPALLLSGFLLLCSMASCFATAWILELNALIPGNTNLNQATNYVKWYYLPTHTRAAPWIIGFLVGYFIFQFKQGHYKLRWNKLLILFLWAVSLATLLICLFVGHNLMTSEYNKVANALHITFARPAWAIAISWIIFACVTGYGGPVNWFLSLPIFEVVSKFTYTIYLIHFQLILLLIGNMRTPPEFSDGQMMYVFWGDFALTMVFAVIITLTIESPLIAIESIVLRKPKKCETHLPTATIKKQNKR